MKTLIGSLIIFFATLLAAGLVALGQPSDPSDMGLPWSEADRAAPAGGGQPLPAAPQRPDGPQWWKVFGLG